MSASLESLRQQLAARFPTATRSAGRTLATGWPPLDDPTGGGLPLGALTEIVGAAPSCGVSLLWQQLLTSTRTARTRVALVDAFDEFDVASCPANLLAHLVWVRCHNVTEALAATDLLARDANFGLVLLDLRHASLRELRRIPATAWYRLQRAVEPAELALVVATPATCVPSAQLRFEFARTAALPDLDRERATLAAELAPALQRQRRHFAATG